jgi:hypothetical protein
MGNKNFIQSAIKHPGAMTAQAKSEGVSNGAFEQEHKHDAGKAGQRARFALVLKGLHHAVGKGK